MTTARAARSVVGLSAEAFAPAELQRRLFLPTTVAFGAVAVLAALLDAAGVRIPDAVQVIPFAVSVLLFGLPHGALDHLVPARLDPRISLGRSIASVIGVYAVLGGVTAGVWVTAPVAGFALFILITWFHWGQGDLWLDRALRRAAPSRTDGVLTVLVRGGLPMLVPLIGHPQVYVAVLRGTTGLLGADSAGSASLLESVPLRAAAVTVLLGAIVAHLLVRGHEGGRLGITVTEIVVLVLFFLAVPPVLAVGLYFTFWHAVRHIVRLELLTAGDRTALQDGHLLQPFVRFLRDSLPVTACAIALLAALALALHSAGLGAYLLLIAALTTPHTAVVTWMDRRRARHERSTRRITFS